MSEEKLINTETVVETTATTISIFTEYIESDEWILATGFWNDEGVWEDSNVWND